VHLEKDQIYSVDSELVMWVEAESSIHIKAVTSYGDPVELSFDEAEKLARTILRWVETFR
jgi:hypothetical protein